MNTAAPAFVIRSMSTTDYRPGEQVRPYHIFLLNEAKRPSAWWSRSTLDAMQFDSETQANAYIALMQGRLDSAEVAPIDADARGLPTFWDNQKAAFIKSAGIAGCKAAQAGQPRDTFHPYNGDAARAWYAAYDNAKGFERETGRVEPLLDR